jgi:hypothetical protein
MIKEYATSFNEEDIIKQSNEQKGNDDVQYGLFLQAFILFKALNMPEDCYQNFIVDIYDRYTFIQKTLHGNARSVLNQVSRFLCILRVGPYMSFCRPVCVVWTHMCRLLRANYFEETYKYLKVSFLHYACCNFPPNRFVNIGFAKGNLA